MSSSECFVCGESPCACAARRSRPARVAKPTPQKQAPKQAVTPLRAAPIGASQVESLPSIAPVAPVRRGQSPIQSPPDRQIVAISSDVEFEAAIRALETILAPEDRSQYSYIFKSPITTEVKIQQFRTSRSFFKEQRGTR